MKALFTHKIFLARAGALAVFLCVGLLGFHATAHAGMVECFADFGKCIAEGTGKIVATLLSVFVGVFAVFLGWAASFFNFAMLVTVYQFANFFGNSDGLRLAWGILRDMANILLLFGFIFIGVTTILDANNSATKKTLPMLIIVAILLNFSLFVSEAVIDISNAVASTFYAQAGDIDCSAQANDNECANLGIAGKIMEISGIAPIFDVGDSFNQIWSDAGGTPAQKIVIHFGFLVFIVVMIATFLAGTFILVSRAITLVFLFITSPVGFAGIAIPRLHDFSKWWQKELTSNVVFAPVYVLFMLISIKLIEGVRDSFLPSEGASRSIYVILTESNPLSIGGIFILFALVSGFMGASLIFAKKSGVMFADKASNIALRWAGNTIGSFSTAPVAWGFKKLGEGYTSGLRGMRSARVLGMPVGKPLTFVAGALGGAALDRGVRDVLKSGESLKIPGVGAHTISELREARKKRGDELDALDKKDKQAKDLAGKKADLDKAVKEATKVSGRNTDNLEKVVNGMSPAQLRETDQFKGKDEMGLAEMAKAMSGSKFKQVMEDAEVGDNVKQKLKTARFGEFKRLIKDAADPRSRTSSDSRTELARWSTSDFEMSGVLDPDADRNLRAQAVRAMSDSQYEGIQKGGVDTLGRNAKRDIKNLREDPDTSGSRFHRDHIADTFANVVKKPSERAQLSSKVLTHEDVLPRLRPVDFLEIQRNPKTEFNSEQHILVKDRVNNLVRTRDPEMVALLARLMRTPRRLQDFKAYYDIP